MPDPTATAAPKATKTKATSKAKATKSATATNFQVAQRAAILLKQAADPTRLQIVRMLANGEMHVGAICKDANIRQPACSHHLALMRHGGIIEARRQGKQNWYRLTPKGRILATAVDAVMAEDARG